MTTKSSSMAVMRPPLFAGDKKPSTAKIMVTTDMPMSCMPVPTYTDSREGLVGGRKTSPCTCAQSFWLAKRTNQAYAGKHLTGGPDYPMASLATTSDTYVTSAPLETDRLTCVHPPVHTLSFVGEHMHRMSDAMQEQTCMFPVPHVVSASCSQCRSAMVINNCNAHTEAYCPSKGLHQNIHSPRKVVQQLPW